MMEMEHVKDLTERAVLTKQKLITIAASPTESANNSYKKLSDKSTEDFDKDYCDMMVDRHKDAIAVYEKASNDCADADIKVYAAASLQSSRAHLDYALTCQKNYEKIK